MSGIKPSWDRQTIPSNHAGKMRPLPTGLSNLLEVTGAYAGKFKTSPLPEGIGYEFDRWCDTPKGIDRKDLLLFETWVPSKDARLMAKGLGGGRKVAMRFWFAMLMHHGHILGGVAKRYYQAFMSEMNV